MPVVRTFCTGTGLACISFMHVPLKHLQVKTSTLPGAGKGLFTKVDIPKGTIIIEYKGRVTTWDKVKDNAHNAYIYYISSRHVIDAEPFPKEIARYANDARGLTRLKGTSNNCVYERIGRQVFVRAAKDISAGSELLVSYGKGYWDTQRRNERIAKEYTLNEL